MAKLIFVCLRNLSDASVYRERLERMLPRLTPDHLSLSAGVDGDNGGIAAPIFAAGHYLLGILNATPAVGIHSTEKELAVRLGLTFDSGPDWRQVEKDVPDGSYAIVRGNAAKCEVLSDAAGTRTLWYYFDERVFIVSSSQRAIVGLLGSFEFNEKTVPWMLASGNLGPEASWDRRVRRMQADSVAALDCKTWQLTDRAAAIEFRGDDSPENYLRQLREALQASCAALSFDPQAWLLPLSGGYDSRGILCMLREKYRLQTLTWGAADAPRNRGSDAYVARRLAETLDVPHRFWPIQLSNEGLERLFARFLVCGEGRVDHFAGYLDGFALWKQLACEGVQGILRGDEGFGWTTLNTPANIRSSLGITNWTDLPLPPEHRSWDVAEQNTPDWFDQRPHESAVSWYDRLYHQVRLPTTLAALTDLKASYVEVANPYLSRKVLRLIRRIPDQLRADKQLYRQIIHAIGPPVPFARVPAIEKSSLFLRRRDFCELLQDSLASSESEAIASRNLLNFVRARVKPVNGTALRFTAKLLKSIGPYVKNLIRRRKRTINYHSWAFRLYLVQQMHRMLSEDASLDERDLKRRACPPRKAAA